MSVISPSSAKLDIIRIITKTILYVLQHNFVKSRLVTDLCVVNAKLWHYLK